MRHSIQTGICVLVVLASILGACKKNDSDTDNTTTAAFDRKDMLMNMGNNLIIPGYKNFYLAVLNFDSSVVGFNQNPDADKLLTLQANLKKMYKAWQFCSSYEFGPAEQQYLGKSTNTFPTDVTQITNNITTGSYDLNAVINLDAKGLPAVDYLLFGVGADNNAILEKYTTDANAAARKKYLGDLSTDLKSKIATVYSAWNAGYLDVFVNSAGIDIGSSTSYLYNGFVFDYEVLKNFKFGIPLGRMAGQTTTYPEKVEAYYSGISTELARDHWKNSKNIWEGRGLNGTDGIGFQEYLAASEGGNDLIAQTLQQQANVERTLAALPSGRLSDAIINQFAKVDAANTELQKMTRFYKSDMSSLLGITITFNSGDGD